MDKYLWEHIQNFLSRDDLLCLRETSTFHATCEWFGLGWTVVLSPLAHVLRRVLGRHVMPVHRGPKKRPAASIWPCLPAATTVPATPPRGVETSLVDWGFTLGTQASPVELSGQVGELGVGWTGEGILLHSKKGPRP